MAKRIKPRTPQPRRGQSSEEYWREREARQRAENIKNEARTAEKINRIFGSMQDSIEQEIESFYERYAKKEGIDIAEAKRRVSQLDIEKYERLAKQYVDAARAGDADTAFSDEANEQMRVYNATMRINRLEMLKARCGIRAMEGYSEAQRLINDELEARAYEEYERLAGILGGTVQFNENLVRSIVNASYQNATWSERLWNNQALLSEQIGAQLAQGILTGKSSRVLAQNIQKLTGGSTYNCLRLMRTELRRVQTAAAEQSMRDNGVRQYKFLVENAINPCDECQNLDGHVYDLDELAPGKTAPPIHPNCHCATAPYVDEEKWERWLDGPAQAGVSWEEFESGNAPETPAAPAFTPAKSRAEAEQYASGFADSVNYSGISLDNMNTINEQLSRLMAKYPIRKLESIRNKSIAAMDANYHTLGINGKKLGKTLSGEYDVFAKTQEGRRAQIKEYQDRWAGKNMPAVFKQRIEKLEKQLKFSRYGVHQSYDDHVRVTLTHEYGHILSDQYFGMLNDERANPNYSTNWSLRRMCDKWGETYRKAVKTGDIYKVSEYGAKNDREFFAECFAAREMGEQLPDYVEKLMQEVLDNGPM